MSHEDGSSVTIMIHIHIFSLRATIYSVENSWCCIQPKWSKKTKYKCNIRFAHCKIQIIDTIFFFIFVPFHASWKQRNFLCPPFHPLCTFFLILTPLATKIALISSPVINFSIWKKVHLKNNKRFSLNYKKNLPLFSSFYIKELLLYTFRNSYHYNLFC